MGGILELKSIYFINSSSLGEKIKALNHFKIFIFK
jgi:hypothetical protein